MGSPDRRDRRRRAQPRPARRRLPSATTSRSPASRPSTTGASPSSRRYSSSKSPAAPITHRVLTRAADIRGMSVAEAKRGYPVKLRGIIMYYNPYNTNLVVQDDSAGIYVRVGNSQVPKLEAGQLIDLEGFTGPGDVVTVGHRAAHQGDRHRADAGADADGQSARACSPAPPTASGWRSPASSMPSSAATRARTSACGCTSSASRWPSPASRRCPRWPASPP